MRHDWVCNGVVLLVCFYSILFNDQFSQWLILLGYIFLKLIYLYSQMSNKYSNLSVTPTLEIMVSPVQNGLICKEQISTPSAGKQVTNGMISREGKQKAQRISNAENGAPELGCHGHFCQESTSLFSGRVGVTYTNSEVPWFSATD